MTANTTSDSSPITPDKPVTIDSQSELDEFVDEHSVVLVDFYADWCGPCQMLEPIVERLAERTDASVGTVDVDANQQLARTYGVRGVPTLVLFADGEQVEKIVGVQQEDQLRTLVESYTK
ncbi:thioredoxin [Halorussus aquaticus]|uniref:Thioredoxin n=1 Tax=Halorussus aquaticus TaxID=2953748 RepID=A0ABD5Q8K8_9EURY|nr:thioredoxin [Halorussus aquaticus]